jgi:hypothetical protein
VETTLPTPSQDFGKSPSGPIRGLITDAIRFWEPCRVVYNLVLLVVTMAWLIITWPHFRPMVTLHSLLLLTILALLANAFYCAAYLADFAMQSLSMGAALRRQRWVLWLAGTLFAILLANYWIADEIYPFVQ